MNRKVQISTQSHPAQSSSMCTIYHPSTIIFITITPTIAVTFDYLSAIIGHRSFWLHAEPRSMSHDVTRNLSTAQAPVTWCQQRHSKVVRSSVSAHERHTIPQPAYATHRPQTRDRGDMTGLWQDSTLNRARHSHRCSVHSDPSHTTVLTFEIGSNLPIPQRRSREEPPRYTRTSMMMPMLLCWIGSAVLSEHLSVQVSRPQSLVDSA